GWFKQRFAEMLAEVVAQQPGVLLLIDYPGFNLRFAKAVREKCPQTRIVYYVSPQVWAWNKGRLPKMARLLDQMICLFPFEVPLYDQVGLACRFVGHPLVDELEEKRVPGVVRDERLVALMPGSREREVARLLPLLIGSARDLREWRGELRFEVPAASEKLAAQIRSMIAAAGAAEWIEVRTGSSHSLMQRACCGVIASGTATLEAAYYGLPYGLVYRVAPLTYLMAKLLVKIEFIGIVNILAGREVIREFIQGEAVPANVVGMLKPLIESPAAREALQRELAATTAKLGEPGAHARVAAVVAEWFGKEARA
ncbi:MAG TPA: lipid-A-disaccharide synthase, partial [Luteolibacter sp.]|nr:lipid-A-disaccharide synthase [Luteolibacter sp.]